MEKSLFDNLLNLYGQGSRTPLEDFTTEILAVALESNNDFKNIFIKEILGIAGSDYTIDTQESFNSDSKIDMVFKNSDSICFLENKVEKKENEGQLEKYKAILLDLEKEKNKKVYLRYCTKYYDPKKISDVDFRQFRWLEVAKLIIEKLKIEMSLPQNLLCHFYNFLQNNRMAEEIELNQKDVETMKNMKGLLGKITGITIQCKSEFDRYFGESKQSTLRDILDYERFIIWTSNFMISRDIALGFEWDSTPRLAAWVTWWKGTNLSETIEIVSNIKKKKSLSGGDNSEYIQIKLYKDLPELTKENETEYINSNIEKWFNENIDILRGIVIEYSALGWKDEEFNRFKLFKENISVGQ